MNLRDKEYQFLGPCFTKVIVVIGIQYIESPIAIDIVPINTVYCTSINSADLEQPFYCVDFQQDDVVGEFKIPHSLYLSAISMSLVPTRMMTKNRQTRAGNN